MAEKYSKVLTRQLYRVVTIPELEKALTELSVHVETVKKEVSANFQHIYDLLMLREEELMEELDLIPDNISLKIIERKASIEQLTRNREETETQLQANSLNEFLTKQLTNINTELANIQSEHIDFPKLSLKWDIQQTEEQIKDTMQVIKTKSPYKFRDEPVWANVDHGEQSEELYNPQAIDIDPRTQLIYVTELGDTHRIQVFSCNGEYYSSLVNPNLERCSAIKISADHIYVNSVTESNAIMKLSKTGKTVSTIHTGGEVKRFDLTDDKLFCISSKSLTVEVLKLDLKLLNNIHLKAESYDKNTNTMNLIVQREQIIVLFSSSYCIRPIQIFKLNGTLIHCLVSLGAILFAATFCIDGYGNFIVSDQQSHCIKIISQDGILINNIGREGITAPGELYSPRGVIVDGNGRIVLVDWKHSNKLQAF
ncbi:NHL repeat containing protein [Oopsacas minuta]|uniref:NHL repeat containing protein n=1 Tax=Oopsacas minuta TaxID=111878 RepID=A0AAV7JRK7_9METZ|nr:NHL repeat containing protein [Oopsacas minuta]